MTDYAHDQTNKYLATLERRIKRSYSEASKEMDKVISEYFIHLEKRDSEQKTLLQEGKITEEQYTQWRMAQIGRGERFKALRDDLSERVYNANTVAIAYVNDAMPSIYALNRNYTAYTIEQVAGNVGFTLWDEQTVKRLIKEQPNLMPNYPAAKAVKRGIDLAYSKKQITTAVTSGILQGKSTGKIAQDLMQRIESMEWANASRAARTAVTAAQNGGRQDSYERAAQMGIKVQKRWVATKDLATRHSHQELDGTTINVDEDFISVLGSRMKYPGDRRGKGGDIYNCRCTVRTVEKAGIEAEPRQMRVRNPETGQNELVSNMTYNEWASWKQSQV